MTDPFASQPEAPAGDTYDPFGTSQPEDRTYDGPLLSFPRIADLDKHLVVMEPVAYTDSDPDPFAPAGSGKTRELFTVRLTVLSGAPLELENRAKNEAGDWAPDGTTTTVGAGEQAWPVTWGKFSVPQMAVIGQLKAKWDVKASEPKDGGFLLGIVRRAASKQTAKGLTTPDQIDEALVAYHSAKMIGKNPPEIKFGWKLTNYSESDKALALDWYRNRATPSA